MAKKKPRKKVKRKVATSAKETPKDPDGTTVEVLDAEAGKQIVRRNDGTGRFAAGTNTGGRPKGSVDGIALARALLAKHVGEMSATGAEFDRLFKELRETKGGVWRIFKMGLKAFSEEQRAAASGNTVNVHGTRTVNIVIVEETAPMKQVESRVLEDGGNGKAV